ncbi:MAG: hypothetical protein C0621_03900 [Desulfuromonas sp.]|nr:MAG: hypothetical protein C0621_03900 [Desulfuromonas sp.]
MRSFSLLLLFLLFGAEATAAGLNQRDWLINLVDTLGLSFGLPEEPNDADYLRLVSGERSLRIEAEDHHQREDYVSVNTFRSFGKFSGDGWVNGVSKPTTAHLRFLLPHGGTYQLSARLRLPGHQIELGGKHFSTDAAGNHFSDIPLGEVTLSAGEQEAVLYLPPNGSIDYIELTAPNLFPIAPRYGWDLDASLTADDLAITTLRALNLERFLPITPQAMICEAEETSEPCGSRKTTIRHLGAPSAGAWQRAGNAATTVKLSFESPQRGICLLELRAEGKQPITLTLNGKQRFEKTFPPYLKTERLGVAPLEEGEQHVTVALPPRGGVDALFLTPLDSSAQSYLQLAGLSEKEPTASDVNSLLTLIARLSPLSTLP